MQIKQESGCTIVTFQVTTLIDAHGIERLASNLSEITNRQKPARLILNFASVKALASRMLGVLLTLKKETKASGGGLVLCGVSASLRKAFKITNLEQAFTFCESEADARRRVLE